MTTFAAALVTLFFIPLSHTEDTRSPISCKQELCNVEPPNVDNHKNVNLLPQDCGVHLEDRIIPGDFVTILEFPWMALLSYKTKTGLQFLCGGSIINDQYILTSADCISDQEPVSVRIGEHNIETTLDCEIDADEKYCVPPAQDLPILELIPHPNFNKQNKSNDIGLIKVPKMNFSIESIKPICLPLHKVQNFDFVKRPRVLVTGWVRRYPEMRRNIVSVIDLEVCKQKYKNLTSITHHQICTNTKKDNCIGIGGNPLQSLGIRNDFPRMIQHGVASFGAKLCSADEYQVFTRVAFYMNWILNTITP